jgi:hypothetical protein
LFLSPQRIFGNQRYGKRAVGTRETYYVSTGKGKKKKEWQKRYSNGL